jgi:hypothetical protein
VKVYVMSELKVAVPETKAAVTPTLSPGHALFVPLSASLIPTAVMHPVVRFQVPVRSPPHGET